jgi:hypothetical protein
MIGEVMKNNYLPIGTIVILKGSNQKIMITGYFCSKKEKLYQYSGCIYPDGLSKKTLMFNNADIKKIIYMGLEDDEYLKFKNKFIDISKKYTEMMYKISNRIIYLATGGDKNV